ncbi:MAG: DUF2189 domain-containing protein, partial [Rubrivivax sp.]|nr:DUF2189 domain-containing protein [Rubrivivax sp.]
MPESRSTDDWRRIDVRVVPLPRPFHWLALGAKDLWRCPLPGLVHGFASAAFGALLITIFGQRFWLLAGAFSGFLIVAPLVATGLYAVSSALQGGGRAGLATALQAWRPKNSRLVLFGLLLALAGTGWVLTSAGLITRFAPAPVTDPVAFLRVVVLAPDSWLFEAWLLLGGVLAAPVFASSVVAIPLLLDRPLGVRTAVFTSWRVVMANPVTMALWALLIMGLSVLGILSGLLGLIVIVPVLAHASWH